MSGSSIAPPGGPTMCPEPETGDASASAIVSASASDSEGPLGLLVPMDSDKLIKVVDDARRAVMADRCARAQREIVRAFATERKTDAFVRASLMEGMTAEETVSVLAELKGFRADEVVGTGFDFPPLHPDAHLTHPEGDLEGRHWCLENCRRRGRLAGWVVKRVTS